MTTAAIEHTVRPAPVSVSEPVPKPADGWLRFLTAPRIGASEWEHD